AEDGIRDRNVTGVQTCALPISWRSPSPRPSRPSRDPARVGEQLAGPLGTVPPAAAPGGSPTSWSAHQPVPPRCSRRPHSPRRAVPRRRIFHTRGSTLNREYQVLSVLDTFG